MIHLLIYQLTCLINQLSITQINSSILLWPYLGFELSDSDKQTKQKMQLNMSLSNQIE